MGFFDFEEGFDGGYAAVIDKVEFGYNNFGALQATITNLRDVPFTGKDGQLVTTSPVWVTVGQASDWKPTPDGTGFEHSSGDPSKKIRANSGYASLLDRIVELIGEDAAKVRFADGYKSGKCLEGLHLEWATEGAGKDYKFTDKDTGEVKEGKTKGKLMPVNVVEGSSSNGAGPIDVATLNLPADILAELTQLAGTVESGKFMAEAVNFLPRLAEAGITRGNGQDEFIGAVGDGSLYAALKSNG